MVREIYARITAAAVFAILCMAPVAAHAVKGNDLHKKGEVVMQQGTTVHLFHGGRKDMKKDICPNDVMPVYRETINGGHTTSRKVGLVKVVSYAGDQYFQAQVIEGSVQPGDIAKTKRATCLLANR